MAAIDWIAVDWGTTNLRAWAMAGDTAAASVTSPKGMASLAQEEFEPALIEAVETWLDPQRLMPVVACGMVGARQGWVEAPYAPLPSPPLDAGAMRRVETRDRRINVTVVHGLSQEAPPDVMRGEETQLAGLLALEPGFDGIVCLPGTHSKWVELRAGRVERFRTFMTGELFGLLAGQSVLRHAVGTERAPAGLAFEAALDAIAADPAGFSTHLFSVRAGAILAGTPPADARSRLSGLLIGMEIEAMQHLRSAGEVVLIGQGDLSALYARALRHRGGGARTVDATRCTLAGLAAARRMPGGMG